VPYDWKTELPGIIARHDNSCPIRDGGKCTCGPLGYLASVRDRESNRRRVSPLYDTTEEALVWRWDQLVRDEEPHEVAVGGSDLAAMIDDYLRAVAAGTVRDGSDQPYSPAGVRALRDSLGYAESELGTMEVRDVRRRHVQALVDQLQESGVAPDRVLAVADALRGLYAYAIRRELVGFSPVVELDLPHRHNGGGPQVAQRPLQVEATAAGWAAGEPGALPPQVGPPWTPHPFDAYERTSAGFPSPEPEPEPTPTPTPPPYAPPGYTTAPSAAPYGPPGSTQYQPPPAAPYGQPGYTQYQSPPPPYAQPGYGPGSTFVPQPAPPPYGYESGAFSSSMFGTQAGAPTATFDATMQERWLWWTVRIIVIVFVLIALVLVAESV